MKKLILISLLLLTACEDRYRYACQDPAHFQDSQCQHPACEFSQTCPEYLVAPILEKKVEGTSNQVAGTPAQQTASQCR
jgi:hypothetical protein